MDSKNLEKFCSEYCIGKLNVEYKRNKLSQFGIDVSIGATCELELPHDQLLRLIELEAKAKSITKLLNEEKEIRDNCEAARKAYEEYQLLLIMAKREQQNDI